MLLSCSDLSKRYGQKTVFSKVSFTVEDGGPVAFVGENGAGKTSFINLLLGYDKPDTGTVAVLGQPAGNTRLLGRLGVLPQDARLDPKLSLAKQFSLLASFHGFGRKARSEASRVLALTRLSEQADQSPTSLSHGMHKRACIAQALIGKPDLLILDEPTSGLDPLNVAHIRNLLDELQADTDIFISSHNMQDLNSLCRRYLYFSNQTIRFGEVKPLPGVTSFRLSIARKNIARAQALITALGISVRPAHPTSGTLIMHLPMKASEYQFNSVLSLLAREMIPWDSISQNTNIEDALFDPANALAPTLSTLGAPK